MSTNDVKIVELVPSFDKEDFGIKGTNYRLILKKEKATFVFNIFTARYSSHLQFQRTRELKQFFPEIKQHHFYQIQNYSNHFHSENILNEITSYYKLIKSLELGSEMESYFSPSGENVSIHSRRPLFLDHEVDTASCEYLKYELCYKGNLNIAQKAFDLLVSDGEDAVWDLLGIWYNTFYE